MSPDELRAELRYAIEAAEDDLANESRTLEIAKALAREAVHCSLAGHHPMAHYLATRAATLRAKGNPTAKRAS
jgi:hypothetical protein